MAQLREVPAQAPLPPPVGEDLASERDAFVSHQPHGSGRLGVVASFAGLFVLIFGAAICLWLASPRHNSPHLHPDLGGTGGLPNLQGPYYRGSSAQSSMSRDYVPSFPALWKHREAGREGLPVWALNAATVPEARGSRAWLKSHHDLQVTAHQRAAATRVLFMGDTADLGLGGTWEDNFEGLKALNLGASGDLTQHLLWRLRNGVLPDNLQPKVVLVCIGSNNLLSGMSVENTVGGVATVVMTFLRQRPKATIIMLGLLPRGEPGDSDDDSSAPPSVWKKVVEVNEGLRRIADDANSQFVGFLDCADRFVVPDRKGGPGQLDTSLIVPSQQRLTKAGVEEWASCIVPAVQSLMSEG